MIRRSDFQEIIGAIFAIIILLIFGSAIVGSLKINFGLNSIITFIFFIGGLLIIIALIKKVIDIFN